MRLSSFDCVRTVNLPILPTENVLLFSSFLITNDKERLEKKATSTTQRAETHIYYNRFISCVVSSVAKVKLFEQHIARTPFICGLVCLYTYRCICLFDRNQSGKNCLLLMSFVSRRAFCLPSALFPPFITNASMRTQSSWHSDILEKEKNAPKINHILIYCS